MRHPSEWDHCECGRPKLKRAVRCRACFCGTTAIVGPIEDLVWGRIERSEPESCWPWRGVIGANGYGYYSGRLAHRLVWTVAHGPIPDGLFVCHHCDNPPCCNPAHLFLGTNADNLADAVGKGRMSRGESHWAARLTEDNVLAIRQERASGALHRELADKYGVSRRAIGTVLSGQSWGWLVERPVQQTLAL